ncbi:PD-(D/E)XK nuclease family protein [Candidatus Parcubacteria bacterium]|nr:PD-(D/E)XK nuclease family protein [Candidatus Parcubacteria bacterium]
MVKSWSATALAAYDCPYRYWLRYFKKVRVPTPPIVALGAYLHQFLAWAHNSAPAGRPFFFKTAQSMGKAWFGRWADYCQKQGANIAWGKDQRKEQQESLGGFGYNIAVAYYNYITNPPYPMRITGVEQSVSATWQGFRLTGTVDQLWYIQPCLDFPKDKHPNGALVVVDLTIGHSYKGTQLTLYKVAMENRLTDPRFRKKLEKKLGFPLKIAEVATTAVLSLSGLTNPKRRDTALTFYPAHPAILLDTLRNARDGAETKKFKSKPSPNHCTYCFYRQVCQYARPEGYGSGASKGLLVLSEENQLPPPPKQGSFPGWLRGEK